MTTCKEFKEALKACEKEQEKRTGVTVRKVNELLRYLHFIKDHPELKFLSMKACKPLIKEWNPVVLEKAIKTIVKQYKQSMEESKKHKRYEAGEYAKDLQKFMGGKRG